MALLAMTPPCCRSSCRCEAFQPVHDASAGPSATCLLRLQTLNPCSTPGASNLGTHCSRPPFALDNETHCCQS